MTATTKSQVIIEAAKVLNGRLSSRKDPNLNLAILEGRLQYLCQDLAEDRVEDTLVRVNQIIQVLFVKKVSIRDISLADLIRVGYLKSASIPKQTERARTSDTQGSLQKSRDRKLVRA